jgi:type IV secretory pathway component VirB8
MSLNLSDTQRVTIWNIEDKEKFALVRMSSSRKIKDSNPAEYKNSNWSYVRFVGKAYEKIASEGLKEKDRIVLKGATVALEDYMEDGVKKYPKTPRITVFNWEHAEANTSSRMDTPPTPEEEEEPAPF